MENGINLSLTKSLVDFDKLLEQAVLTVSSKKLALPEEFEETDAWKFQVGRYVQILMEDETEKDLEQRWTQKEIDQMHKYAETAKGHEQGFTQEEIDQLLVDAKTKKDENPFSKTFDQIFSIKPEEPEKALFWIGFDWGENDSIWLEFDAKTCPSAYWDKLNKLVGTSGEYYSKVDFEFVQVYMNAWIHFYLKEEHLKQFYNQNESIQSQKGLLTAFIAEVVGKL